MRRLVLLSALLLASTAAVASPQIVAKQNAGDESVKNIIGAKISNPSGDNVGDINYLLTDPSGKITTAVIGVGGFLGMGEKDVGVAFNELKMQMDRDGKSTFVLNATKDDLKAAPAFEWTQKPSATKPATSSD